MRAAAFRVRSALAGVALASWLGGCAGDQAAVTFSVVAPGDGTAQVTAVVRAENDAEIAVPTVGDPSQGGPPPDWLDESAVVRMNGTPVPRVGDSRFAATLPGFVTGTPIELQLALGVEPVLVTWPVQIEPATVLGPPPASARSASEDLTVSFEQTVSSEIVVLVRDPLSAAVAVTFDAPGDGDFARVVRAADLQALREQALVAGAPSGPEGFAVDLVTAGVVATRDACDVSGQFRVALCLSIVQVILDSRPLVLTP